MKSYAKLTQAGDFGPLDSSPDRPVRLHAYHEERLTNQHRLRDWLVETLSENFPGEAEVLADEFLLRHEKALRMDLRKNMTCFVARPK